MKKLLYIPLFLSVPLFPQAQPFNTVEYIDINNIKAGIQLHGDMWYDYVNSVPLCEFPKGSGKHIMAGGALWIGGYDNMGSLSVSAQTYRQSGNDFWPGPLDAAGSLSATTSQQWARIWKINRSTIDSFKKTNQHTLTNIPAPILEWPAKNNPYAKGANGTSLFITTDMAPFEDRNNDGKYDPLAGDYPKIKGDQMLWWVFSDNGPTHSHTPSTPPMKLQIQACAYGYKRNTLMDNVVYYEYYITNKSNIKYDSCSLGIWADADLGYHLDDYIGFDSSHRMGYVYNSSGNDPVYNNQVPVAGITLLRSPGDAPPAYVPAGGFMYYNNSPSPVNGNPSNAVDLYYLLNASWLDGSHLKNDFVSPGSTSWGTGSGPNTNYVYPGDPGNPVQWSECASQNPGGDRRFIISTDNFSLSAGSGMMVAFALVATNPSSGSTCPGFSMNSIKEVADTAWQNFKFPVGIQDVAHTEKSLAPYPNPASGKIFIDIPGSEAAEIAVYDATGKKMAVTTACISGRAEINIATLPAGIYHISCIRNDSYSAATFIKQ